ncbi:hypothetical protein BHE74_00022619, partial [Ensete ventricosum]
VGPNAAAFCPLQIQQGWRLWCGHQEQSQASVLLTYSLSVSIGQTLSGPVTDPSQLPKWNYDGSSTGQAPGEDSEVIL